MKKSRLFRLSVIMILIHLLVLSNGSGSLIHVGIMSTQGNIIKDGLISADEYDFVIPLHNRFTLYWTIAGETIFIAIAAETTGWVGIGFGASDRMLAGDIIMGYVTEGNVTIQDQYSQQETGVTSSDVSLGGTNGILSYNGSEINGNTTLEFSRLLGTGDEYDNPILTTEKTNTIWAIGSKDDFTSFHVSSGTYEIDYGKGEFDKVSSLTPLSMIAGLCLLAIILRKKGIRR